MQNKQILSEKYSSDNIPHYSNPLSFAYESTGIETYFRDMRDPYSRARHVFHFHKPETLYDYLSQEKVLRSRLAEMNVNYPLVEDGLIDCQIEAIKNLEKSFAMSRQKSLISFIIYSIS